MSDLPADVALRLLIRSAARQLPMQLGELLDAPRFAEGAAALKRFADAAHVDEAVNGLGGEDAAWLELLLRQRWERVGTVVLDPEVAVVAPRELWVGATTVRHPLSLSAVGVDPGFEAVWEGAVVPAPPGRTAMLLAPPPQGTEPVTLHVRAHVRATVQGARQVLIARASIALRRPNITVDEERRRFAVRDHTGRHASRVRIQIGTCVHVTNESGLVELDQPAPAGATLQVEGTDAGRVPPGGKHP